MPSSFGFFNTDFLYNRRVRVTIIPSVAGVYKLGSTVDATVVENLQVKFKIIKDLKPQANRAEIDITNLSPATRAKVSDVGTRIILEAGYPTTMQQIFTGDLTYSDQKLEAQDWATKIECGDGQRALSYAQVNESFKPNTKMYNVVQKVSAAVGLDIGDIPDTGQIAQNGWTAHGNAANALNDVLQAQGLEWSIQDGKLIIIHPGDVLKDKAILISPDHGMIGSPGHAAPTNKQEPTPIKVRSLLQPSCRPGGTVNLQSAAINGSYRIERIEHTGDTHGSDWYTDFELNPVKL